MIFVSVQHILLAGLPTFLNELEWWTVISREAPCVTHVCTSSACYTERALALIKYYQSIPSATQQSLFSVASLLSAHKQLSVMTKRLYSRAGICPVAIAQHSVASQPTFFLQHRSLSLLACRRVVWRLRTTSCETSGTQYLVES